MISQLWRPMVASRFSGAGARCINTGGGKGVFPEEVEEALKAHPDIIDALVVAVPDPRFRLEGRRGLQHARRRQAALTRRSAGALPRPRLPATRSLVRIYDHENGFRDAARRQARLQVGRGDRPRAGHPLLRVDSTPQTRGTHVSSTRRRGAFPGYPARGWFVIGVSKEAGKPRDVRPIKYFGREMVTLPQ